MIYLIAFFFGFLCFVGYTKLSTRDTFAIVLTVLTLALIGGCVAGLGSRFF